MRQENVNRSMKWTVAQTITLYNELLQRKEKKKNKMNNIILEEEKEKRKNMISVLMQPQKTLRLEYNRIHMIIWVMCCLVLFIP